MQEPGRPGADEPASAPRGGEHHLRERIPDRGPLKHRLVERWILVGRSPVEGAVRSDDVAVKGDAHRVGHAARQKSSSATGRQYGYRTPVAGPFRRATALRTHALIGDGRASDEACGCRLQVSAIRPALVSMALTAGISADVLPDLHSASRPASACRRFDPARRTVCAVQEQRQPESAGRGAARSAEQRGYRGVVSRLAPVPRVRPWPSCWRTERCRSSPDLSRVAGAWS